MDNNQLTGPNWTGLDFIFCNNLHMGPNNKTIHHGITTRTKCLQPYPILTFNRNGPTISSNGIQASTVALRISICQRNKYGCQT